MSRVACRVSREDECLFLLLQATALTEEVHALHAEKKVWEDEAAYLARTTSKDEAPLVMEAQLSSRSWEAKVPTA